MRNRNLAAIGLLAFGYVWAMTLSGQDKPRPSIDPKALKEIQQKIVQQFDSNKDGMLSDQEKLAAQAAMKGQAWPVLSGTVGGFPGAEQFFKAFDKNGDGQLSDAEKTAAAAAFQRMRNSAGGNSTPPQVGPGNAGGGTANPKAGGDEPKKKVSPLVKRFDKDGDGKLNEEEKAAAQAELKKGKGKDKEAKP